MTAVVVRSSFGASIARYARSRGLWLLLLAGPVGARFMVARDDGSGVQIAIGRHLPVMTSSVLGVSLGIVVSTLLLPIGFLYLRSNVTRRQPWQIEEVAPASRVEIAFGRFGADVAVLLAMLLALTLAGWFLGWLIVSGPLDVVQVSWTLWLIAAPAVVGLAAVHRLLDARPSTRGGLGDLVFFILWLTSIALPAAVQHRPSSLATNLFDFAGFVRPLTGPVVEAGQDFAIGSSDVLPGRVPLDVMAGIGASGYVASRLVWAAIAVALTILAGLIFRPHVQPRRRRWRHAVARLLSPGAPPAAESSAPAAEFASPAPLWLVVGEFRLIGAGRLFKLLAITAALRWSGRRLPTCRQSGRRPPAGVRPCRPCRQERSQGAAGADPNRAAGALDAPHRLRRGGSRVGHPARRPRGGSADVARAHPRHLVGRHDRSARGDRPRNAES